MSDRPWWPLYLALAAQDIAAHERGRAAANPLANPLYALARWLDACPDDESRTLTIEVNVNTDTKRVVIDVGGVRDDPKNGDGYRIARSWSEGQSVGGALVNGRVPKRYVSR